MISASPVREMMCKREGRKEPERKETEREREYLTRERNENREKCKRVST